MNKEIEKTGSTQKNVWKRDEKGAFVENNM